MSNIGETLKEFVNRSAHIANDFGRCFPVIATLRMYDTCKRASGDNWLYAQQDAIAVGAALGLALTVRRLQENLKLKSYKGGKDIRLIRFSDDAAQIYEASEYCNLYRLSSKLAHTRRLSVYGHYVHVLTALGRQTFPASWDKDEQKFSRVIVGESTKDPRFVVLLSEFLDECEKLLMHIAAMKPAGMDLKPPSRVT